MNKEHGGKPAIKRSQAKIVENIVKKRNRFGVA
jgi:hypothetical protein